MEARSALQAAIAQRVWLSTSEVGWAGLAREPCGRRERTNHLQVHHCKSTKQKLSY